MKRITFKTAVFADSAKESLKQYSSLLLFLLGVGLLVIGNSQMTAAQQTFSEAQFDDELIRNAVGNLFQLIEGAFGALLMVIAGIAAIIAAAMGAYRASVSLLVVAVGAFILRALVSLFFGGDYEPFGTGG